LGIGEAIIIKAIGEATGRTVPSIKAQYDELGDLGLVAQVFFEFLVLFRRIWKIGINFFSLFFFFFSKAEQANE
jgi:hypothetical protein